MRIGTISAGILLAMTAGAIAQSGSSVQETSKVLNAAKAGGQAESAQIAREHGTDGATLDGLAQQAQRALAQAPDTGQQNRMAADGRKLEDTLKTLSPEAQKLLSQSNALPAMRAPDPDAATAAVKTAPAVPAAAAPKAAPVGADEKGNGAKPGEAPAKKDNNVHITSQGAAYFDSREAIGVFTDDVVVNHPGFQLFCEQLEVYMLKDDEKKKMEEEQAKKKQQQAPAAKPGGTAISAPGTPTLIGGVLTSTTAARTANPDEVAPVAAPAAKPADAAPASKEPEPDNTIRQAIARGPKVTIVKNTETGEPQIGVCRTATYIGENGDIIMRDMPLVQRDNNVHYATDPSTYMIIKQNGELKTFGPAKTDIIQKEEKKGPAPAGAAVAPVTPPPPGPAKPAKAGPAKPAKKGKP